MLEEDDFLLINNIKNGDQPSFDKLFRKYYVMLTRFVYQIVRNQTIAEEIAQDVFVVLWEQKEKISIQSSVRAYLIIASRNATLNQIKKNETRKKYEKKVATEQFQKSTEINETEENTELVHLIEKSIDQLPEKCREIFLLSRQTGLTYQEISENLKISKKTVENQMTIALRKLREYILPFINKFILFIPFF
jgi:RNA polymerase sigma-70 factor (ECF subfamily)